MDFEALVPNDLNNNQHYITESFVKRRFGTNGFVARYDVKHDCWKFKASPQFIFSGRGYTQFLEEGQPVDNSLEREFSKLENELKCLFPALDGAAEQAKTSFPENMFQNLCFYCAFLWYLSPFAKAKAPAEFVLELDLHLKKGNWDYLLQRGMPENMARWIQAQHDKGFRFILEGENYLQFLFRDQFVRKCQQMALFFRHNTKWTVYKSPIELPISDIALVDYPEGREAQLYILPISPNRVLIGRAPYGSPPPHWVDTIVSGATLTEESAENVLDIICGSAVKVVACKSKMDIKGSRERAQRKNFRFTSIANLDAALSAGMKVFDRTKDLRLIPVSQEEFVRYAHSFIRPP